ncbi:unnamed protein product [Brassica rapa]|uniref:DUF1764 domain-containing protein n=1 Tax=Brassica campestris TaxID=3711 RepID=A0A3P6C8D2_BRACM|nr:unnamed protein product [Brassica rapa]VDD04682.1 unnamed protein product [Brassica rapa]
MSKKKSNTSSSQAGDKPSLQQKKEIDDIFGGGKNKKQLPQEGVKPATVQTKKTGKIGKEIDDIFGGRKKKKMKVEVETSEKEEATVKKARVAKRKRSEVEGFNSNQKTGPRKRTEDGLLVFTEDELGINKANAGNTPLCPFDCQCCF